MLDPTIYYFSGGGGVNEERKTELTWLARVANRRMSRKKASRSTWIDIPGTMDFVFQVMPWESRTLHISCRDIGVLRNTEHSNANAEGPDDSCPVSITIVSINCQRTKNFTNTSVNFKQPSFNLVTETTRPMSARISVKTQIRSHKLQNINCLRLVWRLLLALEAFGIGWKKRINKSRKRNREHRK